MIPTLSPEQLRLAVAIQEARQSGFNYFAEALAELLRRLSPPPAPKVIHATMTGPFPGFDGLMRGTIHFDNRMDWEALRAAMAREEAARR